MQDFLISPEEEDSDCDEELVFVHMSRINGGSDIDTTIWDSVSCHVNSPVQHSFFIWERLESPYLRAGILHGKCNLLLSR